MKTTGSKLLIFKLPLAVITLLLAALTGFAAPANDISDSSLLYSTFLGGELADYGTALTADQMGNVYISGSTLSTIFPAPASTLAGKHGVDVFVVKIDPNGERLLFVLWFNAISVADVDEGFGIAVDQTGHAYVTGHTRSSDFCTLFGEIPGYDTTYNDNGDAFLLKVKADGSGLVYCTFLGGSDWDSGTAVVVDDAGNATVTGGTWSGDFPTTANASSSKNKGLRDAFATSFDPTGTALIYSSYIGGSSQEEGRAIIGSGQGKVAIAGWTNSANFPTTADSFDPTYNGDFDAFLAQIDVSTGPQTYGSFLGSAGEDRATGLDTTNNGQILVTGFVALTDDSPAPDFPTTPGAISTNVKGASDAFVVKFNPQGSGLAYSTLIGGNGREQGLAVSANDQGSFAITGNTTSADFPTTAQAFQPKYSGLDSAPDAFIMQFTASGSRVLYSSFLGGDQEDSGSSIFLTDSNHVYISGATRSANFPNSPAALQRQIAGDYDGFITKLVLEPAPPVRLHLPLVLGN